MLNVESLPAVCLEIWITKIGVGYVKVLFSSLVFGGVASLLKLVNALNALFEGINHTFLDLSEVEAFDVGFLVELEVLQNIFNFMMLINVAKFPVPFKRLLHVPPFDRFFAILVEF